MAKYELMINGEAAVIEAAADMPLLWALRDLQGLTGTKYGCGIGQCGACTVHVNGAPTRSCLLPLSAAAGASVTTIEGPCRWWSAQCGSKGLDRNRCCPVWLLPSGSDYVGDCAAEREPLAQ